MVAVQHHMLGVQVGDCVNKVARGVRAGAFGQGLTVKGHAFFQLSRKQLARLQKDEILVIVAKGLLWLQVQINLGAKLMALQGFFNFGQ